MHIFRSIEILMQDAIKDLLEHANILYNLS